MWESVKIQVLKARKNTVAFGLYSIEYLLISRKSIIDGLQQLFDLPLRIKRLNKSDTPYYGYIGQYPEIPLYESLGIEDTLSQPGHDESYSGQLSELDKIVRRMVLESLGLEKYLDEHMGVTDYLIRFQKYDAPKSNDTKLGLDSHKDKKIVVTILYGNEVKGLEVLTKDGKYWIDAEPSKNSFIVMIGEYFHAWTNGRLHAPYHRVMVTGDEARFSVGLFSIPKSGYIMKAPEEMVDEDHPLLFKP
ncbi:hypothetical protein DH2020_041100 [Rehmannia glutinosa]|uniref:Fe2OG dioxygenase domain-containing protein n=1 Tax=Rehmannia glutinosa TaxID=99300 RepID=A0ABR0USA0_REHGL